MRKIIILLLILIVIVSCGKTERTKIDVSNIPANAEILRFEREFYTANQNTLPRVKKRFPALFPPQHDSIWLNKINDSDEQELFAETEKAFPNLSKEKLDLEYLFKHIRYYHRKFGDPKVVTVLTNMDDRVIYVDSLLFISLDNFLGKKHRFYADYPGYIKENNTKEHLIVAVAKSIIDKQIPLKANRSFIDKIIYEGKKMYVLDSYLPESSDQHKIGYSAEKMRWIVSNEENVWRYFIEKNYLYSTDFKLVKRFIEVAPFSKFYLESDSKSPGQVGVYIGWQIVRSFMKNNDVSLSELMRTSENEIFKKSKYKPTK